MLHVRSLLSQQYTEMDALPSLEALVPSLALSPQLLSAEAWYHGYASVLNDRLARRHEEGSAAGGTLKLLRDIAANSQLAEDRLKREILIASRLAAEARKVVRKRAPSAPLGISAMSSNDAKVVFAPLLPTAAPEPDPEAALSDHAFSLSLHTVASSVAASASAPGSPPDTSAVADVIRRHLCAASRASGGGYWRPPSVSEVAADAMGALSPTRRRGGDVAATLHVYANGNRHLPSVLPPPLPAVDAVRRLVSAGGNHSLGAKLSIMRLVLEHMYAPPASALAPAVGLTEDGPVRGDGAIGAAAGGNTSQASPHASPGRTSLARDSTAISTGDDATAAASSAAAAQVLRSQMRLRYGPHHPEATSHHEAHGAGTARLSSVVGAPLPPLPPPLLTKALSTYTILPSQAPPLSARHAANELNGTGNATPNHQYSSGVRVRTDSSVTGGSFAGSDGLPSTARSQKNGSGGAMTARSRSTTMDELHHRPQLSSVALPAPQYAGSSSAGGGSAFSSATGLINDHRDSSASFASFSEGLGAIVDDILRGTDESEVRHGREAGAESTPAPSDSGIESIDTSSRPPVVPDRQSALSRALAKLEDGRTKRQRWASMSMAATATPPAADCDAEYGNSASSQPTPVVLTEAANVMGEDAGPGRCLSRSQTESALLPRSRATSAVAAATPGTDGGAGLSSGSRSVPLPAAHASLATRPASPQSGAIDTPAAATAAVHALLADVRTLAMLFAKGLLVKYPALRALPTSGVLPAPTAAVSAGGSASPSRPGSSTTSSPSSPPLKLDCSLATLRATQELLACAAHPTLLALHRLACASECREWEAAVQALRPLPPCFWGLGHAYCAPGEPGCEANTLDNASEPRTGAPPGAGSAAAAALAVYAQPLACLRLLGEQSSPSCRAAALRGALQCLTISAAVEAAVAAVGASPGRQASGEEASAVCDDGTAPTASSSSLSPLAPTPPPTPSMGLGADDLVPRLCFALVHCHLRCLPAEVAVLEDTLPPGAAAGQDGYALVSLRGALSHVLGRVAALAQASA